jgi:hypothetical protein
MEHGAGYFSQATWMDRPGVAIMPTKSRKAPPKIRKTLTPKFVKSADWKDVIKKAIQKRFPDTK